MAGCNPLSICAPSDGTVTSCKANCACRYCGDANLIATCNSRCVGDGQPAIDALNKGTQDVNNQIGASVTSAASSAASSALSALLIPLQAGIYPFFERAAIFLFAMILVVVGFLVVKQ